MGNVTKIEDGLLNGTAGRNFAYDDLNRLTHADGKFGANQGPADCTYIYDEIGNLRNKCGVAYSYNDPMHPSFVTARDDGKNYAADINGNTQVGDGRTFGWTADNRVGSVTIAGATTSMDYDYTGTRVKKVGPLGTVLYPFAGYEVGPDGTKIKFFKAGNELLAAKQITTTGTTKKLFYHNDHLGGINVVTDDDVTHNGARQQLNEYDPWGKVSRTEGNVDPERRFTGQILDPESGLYYYGARYYDPELGRFISPDPIVPSPGDPQSLNRYSYVRNNPVKYIDPTGHGFWSRVGNFFKNLFRQPEQLFLAAITGGLSIIVQAIAAGIGGAGGIAFAGIMGGPLAALVAANLPGVSGGLEFLGGAMMLASGNPAGILLMTAGGLSFCKAKGCQIASRVFGFAGAVAGMAWSSQTGNTGAPGEGTGPAGEQFAANKEPAVCDACLDEVKLLARVTFAESAREYQIPNAMEGVASTIQNRVESGQFGDTYADVIFQKGQFTSVGGKLWEMAGNPSTLTGPNTAAYARALSVAEDVYYGKVADPTGGAVAFHSLDQYTHPGSTRWKFTTEIGPFKFFK